MRPPARLSRTRRPTVEEHGVEADVMPIETSRSCEGVTRGPLAGRRGDPGTWRHRPPPGAHARCWWRCAHMTKAADMTFELWVISMCNGGLSRPVNARAIDHIEMLI